MIVEHVDRRIPIDALGALAEELAALIGDGFGGCSGRVGLDVRLPDDASDALRAQVRQTVMEFDLNKRTREQRAYQELMTVVEAGRATYALQSVDDAFLRYLLAEIMLSRWGD